MNKSRQPLIKAVAIESQLNEYCEAIRKSLNICTIQDKRFVLDSLNTQIAATNDQMDITASVPLNFITIGQTSECLIVLYSDQSTQKESVDIVPK